MAFGRAGGGGWEGEEKGASEPRTIWKAAPLVPLPIGSNRPIECDSDTEPALRCGMDSDPLVARAGGCGGDLEGAGVGIDAWKGGKGAGFGMKPWDEAECAAKGDHASSSGSSSGDSRGSESRSSSASKSYRLVSEGGDGDRDEGEVRGVAGEGGRERREGRKGEESVVRQEWAASSVGGGPDYGNDDAAGDDATQASGIESEGESDEGDGDHRGVGYEDDSDDDDDVEEISLPSLGFLDEVRRVPLSLSLSLSHSRAHVLGGF